MSSRWIPRASYPVVCALVLLLGASACAPKAPVVVPGVERYPEFAYPLIPETLLQVAPAVRTSHERAWALLQSGDPKAAERAFAQALGRQADFFPATAGLGYIELARGDATRALERFDQALSVGSGYLPALLGRAQSLLKLDRSADAVSAFEAALAVDGSLADVRRRVEALRFQIIGDAVAQARVAEQAGHVEQARSLYESALHASPESAFLLRDLARMEFRLNRHDEALAHATSAVSLDPTDVGALTVIADVYESRGQLDLALQTVTRIQEIEPNEVMETRLDALRFRTALARLPAEYQAISQSDRLTRGELAALIGTRLEGLLRVASADPTVLVTDVRTHWAQPWIMTVARARVMEVFENHTFQPRNPVRRGDLALAVSRVLTLMAQRQPTWQRNWAGVRRSFSDVSPDNLYYQAASLAVTAGILDTADGGTFQAGRVVSGAEAVSALERLQLLAAQLNLGPRG